MVHSQIIDGNGSKRAAHVNDDGVAISQIPYPPMVQVKSRIFVQKFTLDGTADGDNDMLVDGSTTPVEFYIPAANDVDRWISYINFVIADEGASLKEFGGITALTNGCQLFYSDIQKTVMVGDDLKTNWDFMRMALYQTPIPEIKPQKDVEGKVDAYTPCINFKEFMPPYGIKLDAGSRQKLTIKIRDNVSGIDSFNAVAYGFERFE